MCLLTIPAKFGHLKLAECGQNIKKNSGLKRKLVWARIVERRVIETWLKAQMKGIGV